MYKKVDVLFVLDFFLSLKKKKKRKITHYISGKGKKMHKNPKNEPKKKRIKAELGFDISHFTLFD